MAKSHRKENIFFLVAVLEKQISFKAINKVVKKKLRTKRKRILRSDKIRKAIQTLERGITDAPEEGTQKPKPTQSTLEIISRTL